MSECHACATPMENRLKLKKEDGSEPVDATFVPECDWEPTLSCEH